MWAEPAGPPGAARPPARHRNRLVSTAPLQPVSRKHHGESLQTKVVGPSVEYSSSELLSETVPLVVTKEHGGWLVLIA